MLSRFQVVEIASTAAGTHAGRLLAEAGLSVLRLELDDAPPLQSLPPLDENGTSIAYLSANGKKSVLRVRAADRALIARLIAASDAFITDHRGWFAVRSRGTTCHVLPTDGVLQDDLDLPSGDVLLQAACGAASVTGRLSGPPVTIGIPIGDVAAGYFTALGVMNGLIEDKPQLLSVRGIDAIVALLSYMGTCYVVSGEDVGFIGSGHPYIVPYGAFPASDGYVIVGAFTQAFWRKLCTMLDHNDWANDPRFKTFVNRRDNRDILNGMLDAVFRQNTVAYWVDRLRDADVPHAPVHSLRQAVQQPVMAARAMTATINGRRYFNTPIINLAGGGGPLTRPAVSPDWRACLGRLGLAAADIAALVAKAAVDPVTPLGSSKGG
ncbi:MAG: CoA transferase [Alphaproteobacteria bacterium]